ncbi:unnamed protein product [Symbiodinium sp. CCMP2592]|nr:unnamed protein product [Symbiodinium sp. CCMP2592]
MARISGGLLLILACAAATASSLAAFTSASASATGRSSLFQCRRGDPRCPPKVAQHFTSNSFHPGQDIETRPGQEARWVEESLMNTCYKLGIKPSTIMESPKKQWAPSRKGISLRAFAWGTAIVCAVCLGGTIVAYIVKSAAAKTFWGKFMGLFKRQYLPAGAKHYKVWRNTAVGSAAVSVALHEWASREYNSVSKLSQQVVELQQVLSELKESRRGDAEV